MTYAAGSVFDMSVRAERLCGLTWLGDLLWFADAGTQQVVGVDPFTREVMHTLDCPGLQTGLATVAANLVYAAGDNSTLVTVDPDDGRVVSEVRNPRPGEVITSMEGGRQGLWLGYRDLLDLRSVTDFSLITAIGVRGEVSGITVTDRYLVYADRAAESIAIVDVVMEQVALHVGVHGRPTGLAWDGSRIWYCDSAASRLRAIDVPGMVRSG